MDSFRSLQAKSPDIPANMIQADRNTSVKLRGISPIDSDGFSGNFSAQGALNFLSPDERTAQVYARLKYNQSQRTEDKGAAAAAEPQEIVTGISSSVYKYLLRAELDAVSAAEEAAAAGAEDNPSQPSPFSPSKVGFTPLSLESITADEMELIRQSREQSRQQSAHLSDDRTFTSPTYDVDQRIFTRPLAPYPVGGGRNQVRVATPRTVDDSGSHKPRQLLNTSQFDGSTTNSFYTSKPYLRMTERTKIDAADFSGNPGEFYMKFLVFLRGIDKEYLLWENIDRQLYEFLILLIERCPGVHFNDTHLRELDDFDKDNPMLTDSLKKTDVAQRALLSLSKENNMMLLQLHNSDKLDTVVVEAIKDTLNRWYDRRHNRISDRPENGVSLIMARFALTVPPDPNSQQLRDKLATFLQETVQWPFHGSVSALFAMRQSRFFSLQQEITAHRLVMNITVGDDGVHFMLTTAVPKDAPHHIELENLRVACLSGLRLRSTKATEEEKLSRVQEYADACDGLRTAEELAATSSTRANTRPGAVNAPGNISTHLGVAKSAVPVSVAPKPVSASAATVTSQSAPRSPIRRSRDTTCAYCHDQKKDDSHIIENCALAAPYLVPGISAEGRSLPLVSVRCYNQECNAYGHFKSACPISAGQPKNVVRPSPNRETG